METENIINSVEISGNIASECVSAMKYTEKAFIPLCLRQEGLAEAKTA